MRRYFSMPLMIALLMGAATISARAGELYIPLGSANEVVVVDGQSDSIVRRIPGLPAVHGLAGTPDGRYLVAGSYDERAPGEAPQKPAGITEEDHAAHHTRAPADAQEPQDAVSTVSIVRRADGTVVRRIDVPGAVHHVAMSPDGRFAVVTHPNQDAVSAIDLESFEVVATVATGPLPNYAVFTPDGQHLYVSNAGGDTVSDVETAGWTVRRNLAVGASPEHVIMSKDGRTLYVNNVDDGTVSVLSLERGVVTQTFPVGTVLHGIDLSDDGRTLFVAARGEDRLVAVDLSSGVSRAILLAPEPYHLAAIRGSGKLYISSAAAPKVWVIDQESLEVLGEIPIGGKGHQLVQAAGS